jgi:hypothetical protein
MVLVCFSMQSAAPAAAARLGDGLEGGAGGAEGGDAFRLDGGADGATLAQLRGAFPVRGTFHFRCLEEDGAAWRDLVRDDDALVAQCDGTCVIKALDIGTLLAEEELGDDGFPAEGDAAEAYEAELVRLEEIGAAYEQRPACAAAENIPGPESGENNNTKDANTKDAVRDAAKAGIQSAKNIGKKLGNVVGGFFKRGKQ